MCAKCIEAMRQEKMRAQIAAMIAKRKAEEAECKTQNNNISYSGKR
ncbi:MAG: hypothetical protein K6B41_12440 [Butyrivibrio sp.]|nr:hypothetical protein [Butyrivibrio sp.]